jgi:hypothetical protein
MSSDDMSVLNSYLHGGVSLQEAVERLLPHVRQTKRVYVGPGIPQPQLARWEALMAEIGRRLQDERGGPAA